MQVCTPKNQLEHHAHILLATRKQFSCVSVCMRVWVHTNVGVERQSGDIHHF